MGEPLRRSSKPVDDVIREVQAQARKKQDEIIQNSKKVIESLIRTEGARLKKNVAPKRIEMFCSTRKSVWMLDKEPGAAKGALILAKQGDGTVIVSCSLNLAPVITACALPKGYQVEEVKVVEKKAVLPGLRKKGFALDGSKYVAVYMEEEEEWQLPIVTQSGGEFYREQDIWSGDASLVLKMGGVSYTVINAALGATDSVPLEELVLLSAKLPLDTEQITIPHPGPPAYLLIRRTGDEFWEMDVYRVRVNGGDQDYYQVLTPGWDEIWANGQRVTRGRGTINFNLGTLTADGDIQYAMYLHDSGFSHDGGAQLAIDEDADPQAAAMRMFTDYSSDLRRPYSAVFTSHHTGYQMHVPVEDWHGIHVHYSLPVDQWLPLVGRYNRGHLTLETGDYILHSRLRFRYYWNGGFRVPNNIPAGMTTQDVYNLYVDSTTDDPPLATYQELRNQLNIDLQAIAVRFQAQARRWP